MNLKIKAASSPRDAATPVGSDPSSDCTSYLLYVCGKLGQAIAILVTHPGKIQLRLIEARMHLILVLSPERLPVKFRQDARWLNKRFSKLTHLTRKHTAQEIAERFYSFYCAVEDDVHNIRYEQMRAVERH